MGREVPYLGIIRAIAMGFIIRFVPIAPRPAVDRVYHAKS
jgi:hypothetical protein